MKSVHCECTFHYWFVTFKNKAFWKQKGAPPPLGGVKSGGRNVKIKFYLLRDFAKVLDTLVDTIFLHVSTNKKLRGLVRERTVLAERPSLVDEASDNFCR
jgi:hypothetical protein